MQLQSHGLVCLIFRCRRVYALNKKGVIPEELVTLQYLTFLYVFFTQIFFYHSVWMYKSNLRDHHD